ncbi:MAG: TPM domain-containing protein [Prevotellaceae bacterium]|nr:TPM domain-containing protein [Prevotellaceae bacterium]MDY6130325.1 TPM domain-containing protein [Prevotella sp.]
MRAYKGFIIGIIVVGVLTYAPFLLYGVAGEDLTYGKLVGSLLGMSAVFFGTWYLIEVPSLKKKDEIYSLQQKTNATSKTLLNTKKEEGKPSFKFKKLFYGTLFWVVVLSTIFSCSYSLTEEDSNLTENRVWNASNIPLPHLTDRNQYVSNPDTVISQQSVDSMNVVLKILDKELGVQSAIVIVNRVENQDAFRMAQDIGNKYGVGDKETRRGLVIVVAYEDHKYFIAPGQGLEEDLTDANCNQLARSYLTPFLKQDNPDEGMKMLIKATYTLLKEKRLLEKPDEKQSHEGNNSKTSDDHDIGGTSLIFLILWFILYAKLNETYHWIQPSGNGVGYRGYGRSRMGGGKSSWGGMGGFGGGGFGGGGYGGGSFGGGGAGGGW